MSLRSGRTALVCLLIIAASACSSDDKDANPAGVTIPAGATLAPGEAAVSSEPLAPQTTTIPDCGQMPTNTELSTLVGVPLDLGFVTGSRTCEFTGLNDQSRSVVLSLFTDPADQASFLDLQASLGEPTALDDAELAGAMVGGNSVVYLSTPEGLYTVRTTVTDATAAEQVPLSIAVLKHWLTL